MKLQDSAGFEFLAVSCSCSSLYNKNDVMMDSCMLQQHAHAPAQEIWLGSPDRFLMSGWGMGYTDYIIISQSVHSDTRSTNAIHNYSVNLLDIAVDENLEDSWVRVVAILVGWEGGNVLLHQTALQRTFLVEVKNN